MGGKEHGGARPESGGPGPIRPLRGMLRARLGRIIAMIPNRLTPGYAPSAIKAATAPLPPDLAADSVFLLVEGTLLGLGDVTLVPTVRRALAGAGAGSVTHCPDSLL